MIADGESKLGSLLREYRHRRGLTLEDLAERSGVSLRTISDVERGVRRSPHRYTLGALAQALGLDPGEVELLHSLTERVRPNQSAPGIGALPLPRLIPDFIGREDELQRATRVLTSSASPVLTITGPFGFGTTTFATALARAVENQFEATVFLPMVCPENTPVTLEDAARDLIHAIAPAAEAMSDGGVVLQLQSALAGRRILIICDDVAGESQVRDLLPTHGESAVVVTSQHPLAGLDGVSRLPLPALTLEDSIRLLEAIIPKQQRTPADTEELAIFCKRVPLGLRIAGNQVAANPGLTVRTVLERLASHTDRGLGAFTAGDRSLLAAFETSYERLSPEQQTVFRRLCMIDGAYASVDLAAALAGVPVIRTQSVLQELADLAIIEFDRAGRVRLHGFVKVFAQMQIDRDAEAQLARERADEYLLEGLTAAGWWFRTSVTRDVPPAEVRTEPMASLDAAAEWLLAESGDWQAALLRAQAAGKHELVVSLVSHLHWFAQLWPHVLDWVDLWKLAAKSALEIDDNAQAALYYDEITWFLLSYRGDVPRAKAALEIAERSRAKLSEAKYDAWSCFLRARLELETGEYEAGLQHCDEAARVLGANVAPEALLHTISLRAELLGRLGQHEEAILILNEAYKRIAGFDSLEPRVRGLLWANTVRITAASHRALGQLERCIELCTDALERSPDLKGHPSMLAILLVRASAYRDLGDDEAAERDFYETEHAAEGAAIDAQLTV